MSERRRLGGDEGFANRAAAPHPNPLPTSWGEGTPAASAIGTPSPRPRRGEGSHPNAQSPHGGGPGWGEGRPRAWLGLSMAVILAIAGAAQSDSVWKVAAPGRAIVLPADHVSHPDYKIEWWYYTGNLDTREGRRFGYQLTFFRVGVDRTPASASRWAIRDLHMAHFAVSDLGAGQFHAFDRLQRDGAGWAGAATDRYRVWNGQWSVTADADGSHRLRARDTDSGIAIDLHLTNTARWVGHGRDGYSQKGRDPGNASEYYSLPRLTTQGTLTIGGRAHDVTGRSWMDHEFGSSVLEADQVGWDWFGLQLEDGRDVMLYQMRRRDGSRDPFSSGTIISPDGAVVPLTRDDYTLEPRNTWRSPETNAVYPVRWHVAIPGQHLAFDVQAALPNQELYTPHSTGVTYWEGAVDVSGRDSGDSRSSGGASGHAVRGRGYMELTGYNGVPLSDSLR
jgi:predicted secreted hydrolase